MTNIFCLDRCQNVFHSMIKVCSKLTIIGSKIDSIIIIIIFSWLSNFFQTFRYFDEFRLCSYALHVRVCEPRGDGISSFQHLLDNIVLRISVWVVALIACVGNVFVLIGRMLMQEPNEVGIQVFLIISRIGINVPINTCSQWIDFPLKFLHVYMLIWNWVLHIERLVYEDWGNISVKHWSSWSLTCLHDPLVKQNYYYLSHFISLFLYQQVHSFFIKNLAFADLLMGIYLFIIAYYDASFRGQYIKHEEAWRHSWQCNFSGFLSTLSSESSVLILTVITVDRYVSVIHPLSQKRRTKVFAIACMIILWTIAVILAILPLLVSDLFGNEFYGNNGVCLALQIHDPFSKAWEYSTFLFCVLNMAAFIYISYAYIKMSLTIASSRLGLRTTQQQQDSNITKRFGFIVATDCLCWMPIVIIKILALSGNC